MMGGMLISSLSAMSVEGRSPGLMVDGGGIVGSWSGSREKGLRHEVVPEMELGAPKPMLQEVCGFEAWNQNHSTLGVQLDDPRQTDGAER